MTDENSDTLDFGEAAFQDRPELRGHLADTVFRMLAKCQFCSLSLRRVCLYAFTGSTRFSSIQKL